MGEKPGTITSDDIKRNIDAERVDLGRNIERLESKVRDTMDWRNQFQRNPMTMMGLAFGGGVLLSAIIGGRRSFRPAAGRWQRAGEGQDLGLNYQRHKALEIWDNIRGAAIGVAATRFRNYLQEVIPGFREEYRKTEEEKRQSAEEAVFRGNPEAVPAPPPI